MIKEISQFTPSITIPQKIIISKNFKTGKNFCLKAVDCKHYIQELHLC